jgi:uncharacterized protein (TIGR02300 family)
VAKPGLGTKRLCPHCGAKFYDLEKDPIVCAKCGSVVEIVMPTSRGRPEARKAVVQEEAEAPEAADVELVSLEDADADATGGKVAAKGADDDIEVEDDDEEDDTFLATDEDDEDDDVSDIIGGDIETEEET